MTDKTQNTVRASAARDFSDYDDAGNPRNFVKGEEYDLPRGVFDNFASAGLVDVVPASASPKTAGSDKPEAPRA